MARPLHAHSPLFLAAPMTAARHDGGDEVRRGVYFRPLVDLGTGGVAGIETASAGAIRGVGPGGRQPIPGSRGLLPARRSEHLGAWGRVLREPEAYLVRAGLGARAEALAATLSVSPGKVILMFDVTHLMTHPTLALETLIAGKRSGARILLDHIDMADPPARFVEMLPADILRVAPDHMPWHWEEKRRVATMASLLDFAGNLLMDVAVEGVNSDGQCQAFKRLGVRYAQGGWRRDHHGLVPDPAGM